MYIDSLNSHIGSKCCVYNSTAKIQNKMADEQGDAGPFSVDIHLEQGKLPLISCIKQEYPLDSPAESGIKEEKTIQTFGGANYLSLHFKPYEMCKSEYCHNEDEGAGDVHHLDRCTENKIQGGQYQHNFKQEVDSFDEDCQNTELNLVKIKQEPCDISVNSLNDTSMNVKFFESGKDCHRSSICIKTEPLSNKTDFKEGSITGDHDSGYKNSHYSSNSSHSLSLVKYSDRKIKQEMIETDTHIYELNTRNSKQEVNSLTEKMDIVCTVCEQHLTGKDPCCCSPDDVSTIIENPEQFNALRHGDNCTEDKTSVSQNGISQHMQTRVNFLRNSVKSEPNVDTEAKPYNCTSCHKQFSKSYQLKRHVRTHATEKPHKCTRCEKTFVTSFDLKTHMRKHTGERPYKCTLCEKTFTQSCNLLSHMRTHGGDKPYKCFFCEKTFALSRSMKQHMKRHSEERPYTCSVCNKTFKHPGDLRSHNLTHTGEKRYKCSLCEKSFGMSGSLKNHMRIHTGEKPFQCNICNKTFAQSGNRRTHMLLHMTEKPFKCSFCPKTYPTSRDLQRHLLTHSGEKLYKCSSCDKGFIYPTSLKVHMYTHTPTEHKSYMCTFCEKSYATANDLKTHIMRHTGEKPFKCTYCEKTFTTKGELKNHVRTHSGEKPYKCNLCDKTFAQPSGLVCHRRTHTGAKPYKCNICDKAFAYACDRNAHIRAHTGEKRYTCSLCQKQYSRLSSLKSHMKIHAVVKTEEPCTES